MNWAEMYNMFTDLEQPIRERVLRAIADPNRTILTNQWCLEDDGCLFAVAAAAAKQTTVRGLDSEIHFSPAEISPILGLSESQIGAGINLWDKGTDDQRRMFRQWVRSFIAADQSVGLPVELAAVATPEPEAELVGAGSGPNWKEVVKVVVLSFVLPGVFSVILNFA